MPHLQQKMLTEVLLKMFFNQQLDCSDVTLCRYVIFLLLVYYIEIERFLINSFKKNFLQSVCTFVSIVCLSNLSERVAADLRIRLFSNLLVQDAEFFDCNRSTELLSHITHDVHEFKSSFRSCVSQGVRSCSQVLGCAVSLYLTSPELALGLLLTIPSLVAVGSLFGSVLRALSRQCQTQQSKCGAAAGDTLSHVRTVKLFAMEQAERDRYKTSSDDLEGLYKKLGFGVGVFQAMSHLALNALVGCTLLFGGIMVAEHNLQPGQLLSFLVAAQMAQRSLAALSLSFGQFVRCTAAAGRIFACLDLKPVLEGNNGILHIPSPIGDVNFNKVHFAYPTRSSQHVLCDLNLQLPAGKVTAVCGPSGAGKSTLALLLARVYDVNSGDVQVGEHNVRDLDLRWLRGQAIGFISQEPALFATSILENIRYARPDATDRQVQAAARAAHAHEFISELPSGYHTKVGERGLSLSGGQRQRIAIARAILKDPSILILDEATSALDNESERLVNESLDKLMRGRTVLVIAHRLSTIRNADQIAVMNEGRIVEKGSHEQLLKSRGFYWNLWRQQFHEKHQTDSN
jgi:ATP-binding cassette subfamily B (MDR/TAP) protein 8